MALSHPGLLAASALVGLDAAESEADAVLAEIRASKRTGGGGGAGVRSVARSQHRGRAGQRAAHERGTATAVRASASRSRSREVSSAAREAAGAALPACVVAACCNTP